MRRGLEGDTECVFGVSFNTRLCCSSEAGAHPVIARDEDLSSGDDTPPSPAKPVSLEALPVVRRDTPVRPLVQLKSAKDIELTESEEEEKEELPRSTPNKQNDLESYWGRAEGKEGGEGEAKPKAKPKLLLDWTVPEPAKTPKKKESSHDSEGKRERRKKKSSRKGSGKRKGEEAAAFNGTSTPSSAAATDPFGTSSLDAWLNSVSFECCGTSDRRHSEQRTPLTYIVAIHFYLRRENNLSIDPSLCLDCVA